MLQTDLGKTGNAALSLARGGQRCGFSNVGPDSVDRARLEAKIRSGFGMHFGACIEGFMPRFALYRHTSGATGVIGVRQASHEPLYLEHYLSQPIERIITDASDCRVERSAIAEIGQFVVDDRDIVGSFFRELAPFLSAEGYDWVCFTGTNKIRALLNRIGFRGMPVTAADAKRIPAAGDRWGSYYDNDPVVIVGKLDDPEGHWCRGFADQLSSQAGR